MEKENDEGIKVIDYERMIRNKKNVDYYEKLENLKVGVLKEK